MRVGQAVAGALVAPNAMAVVREALPAERRAAGFGMVAAVVGIAAGVGPPLGGAIDAALRLALALRSSAWRRRRWRWS